MKITTIIILAACIQVSAKGFSQVTLSEKNAPLEKVFKKIEQQTGYEFLCPMDLLQKAAPVTVEIQNVTIDNALRTILAGRALDFTISDKTIVIKEKLKSSFSPPSEAVIESAAVINIHGRLVNENGEPVAGAAVQVKGNKTRGTTTNANGEFILRAIENNATLVFSGTNIETFEKKLNGEADLGIIDAQTKIVSGQEVIVSKGYYSVKQKENTGNVTVVTAKTLEQQPVADPIQALIGRVPGLNIQQASGLPGANAVIRLRGQNSIANGNDPLYIVDGVPFSSTSLTSPFFSGIFSSANTNYSIRGGLSPFSAINMEDIETIEVLKDADATAIYGSRGANGVILITTKKGKAGDAKINLKLEQGYSQVAKDYDLLNTQQYLAMRREAIRNDGLAMPNINTTPTDNNYDINGVWDTTRYTDWQKVLIGGKAGFTNLQGSLSGGTDNTQFMIGFGYNRQGVVFPGDFSDQRASAHASINHTSTNKKFHALFTVSYANDNNNLPELDFSRLITLAPDAPALYNTDGSLNWQLRNGTATFTNPMAQLLGQDKAITNNLIGGIELGYRIMPGLELKSSFSYNHDEMNQKNLRPAALVAPPNNNNPGNRIDRFSTTEVSKWIIEPQLNYHKTISKGELNVLVGTTFQQNRTNILSQLATGFVSDALIANPANGTVSISGASFIQYNYTAVYGQASYNWKDKYIINATARRDGSSRFGPGKQFGNFGAGGAAWIFSNEKLVQHALPFLSFGKLRASYGSTGNDQIADYQFISTYSSASTGSATYMGYTGLAPTALANPDFAWEVVKKLEFAADLGFLKDRINLSASYYRNRTGNQLVGYSLPTIAGFTSIQYNLPAIVQNTGLELLLNTVNIRTKNFTWKTDITLTAPDNKLVAFPNIGNFASYKNRYVVGQSLFIQKMYHYTGVNPQTGLYSYATNTQTGLPSSLYDYVITPPVTQKYYGGISNSFNYKGWDLDIFVQYVKQLGQNYLYTLSGGLPGVTNFNVPTVFLDRWQKPGDQTSIGRYGTFSSAANLPLSYLTSSDGTITDASFLRLKTVSLSYQLPARWKKRMHMQGMRLYVQGQNLLTITKLQVFDPEIPATSILLPPLRTIVFGIQATL